MKQCAAFWNHTNLRSGNRIFPCCRFKTPVQSFDGNVSNILHSSEYIKLRQADVSTLSDCSKCMYEEEHGKQSLREKFNQEYTTDSVQLQYFEVGFDNMCDLACDGCWEEWSHTWALKNDPSAIPKHVIISTDELYNIPNSVNKVLFLGGEPLITNRHRRFLKKVKDLKNLEVVYNTNGMHKLQQEDYLLLDKCKSVKFIVSIDGYARLNEQVRSNSVWSTVVDTVNELADRFNLTIHTTIHKNNWHGLLDLYTWVSDNHYNWTTNILTYPAHLDIVNISENDKIALHNICSQYSIPNAEYIKEHINAS
jgi:organic radical activating enzyme